MLLLLGFEKYKLILFSDTIICKHVFNLTIEGYEKDCVNYSCRYTGKVLASFSSKPEYIPKHDLDCLFVRMSTCRKSEDCNNDKSWIHVSFYYSIFKRRL